MLTKELLVFRRRQGIVSPHFLKEDDPENVDFVAELLALTAMSLGETYEQLDLTVTNLARAQPKPKVALGLAKLVLDSLEFAPADPEIAVTRTTVLECAQTLWASTEDFTSPVDFLAAVAANTHTTPATLQSELYADLPDRRPLVAASKLEPQAFLTRYNLAQVQGLLWFASALRLEIAEASTLELRQLFRWLKFCRLIAEVKGAEKNWRLDVDGPASLTQQSRKYGFQLAQFFPVIPVLRHWKFYARIEGAVSAELRLDNNSGLVSPYLRHLGHIPEEIQMAKSELKLGPSWHVDWNPLPRPVGVRDMCVPDLLLTSSSGRQIAIELFHQWHKRVLLRRIEHLQAKKDPHLYLGVDRGLFKMKELEAHPQMFEFNSYPSTRVLTRLVASIESNAKLSSS